MAKIIPFQGTCYNKGEVGDISTVFAPPYDVVTPEERDRQKGLNPYNIFHLELPSVQDCSGKTQDKYDCARQLLNKWQHSGVLFKDSKPCIYSYDIDFKADGGRFTRRGFICLLRTDDWSEGTVLPHEKTFGKVTEDRFMLRMATRAQFSQIFMLYRHQEQLAEILSSGNSQEIFRVQDGQGCVHRLFRMSGRDALQDIPECLAGSPLYIADGHHRYTTAIRYRQEMIRLHGDNPEALYNYTMVYLVDVDDPGMIVLPTHRLVRIPEGMDCEDVRARLAEFFDLEPMEFAPEQNSSFNARTFRDKLKEACSNSITLVFGEKKRAFVLCPRKDAMERLIRVVGHRELARLDVVVLEELVFKGALGINTDEMEAGKDIIYTADSEAALDSLGREQMLFFMHPTPVSQVLDVADAGLSMPHKSTYFYPKILTGLVMNVEE